MFDIFTGDSPVAVPAGATSVPLPFGELASDAATPTVFLRLVEHGPAGPAPTFTLLTDLGPPVVLTGDFRSVTAADGTVLADAATAADPDGTYRIRILTQQLGTHWSLTIANNDTVAHTYLGVVADDLDETGQPWIDVPGGPVEFDTEVGVPATEVLAVHNRGTGTLRITEVPGVGGGPFAVAPASPVPPDGTVGLSITYTPAAAETVTVPFTVASNDLAATGQPGHNHRTTLSAVARRMARGTIVMLFEEEEVARLERIDPVSGGRRVIATFARTAFGQPITYDLVLQPDGQVLVLLADTPGPAVPDDGFRHSWVAFSRVDPLTGSRATVPVAPRIESRVAGAGEPAGTVLVAAHDQAEGVFGGGVIRVDLTAGTSDVLAPGDFVAASPTFFFPFAVAARPDGSLFVTASSASLPGRRVVRLDPHTGARLPAFPGPDVTPAGCLAVDTDGRLLVTSGSAILRIDPATGTREVLAPSVPGVHDLAVEPGGTVVLVDDGGLSRLDLGTGALTSLVANPQVPEGASQPSVRAVDVVR